MKIFPFRWVRNISIAKKLYFTIGVMALLIAIELGTLFFSIHTLSAVRAYVAGEGLWSKAQKDAAYQLLKYGSTHNEQDYAKFKEYMKVPLGDGKTRRELAKPKPNFELARQGFIEGRNHPDDVDGMIKLFRRFNKIYYIDRAIYYWSAAEPLAMQMIPIGERLHNEINSAKPSNKKIQQILAEIDPITTQITPLEDNFSFALSEGSRWLEGVVLKLLFAIAFTVEASGLLLAIMLSRDIQKGIGEIMRAAKSFTGGNLKARAQVLSKDEIGSLAVSFNQMSERLEQNMNQLEFKNKELEQFAYIASHDLQEPLRTVTSFVELLDRSHGKSFNENEKEYMGFIISSAQRMKQQIKALLEYSRIGSEENKQEIDCNKLIREVIDDMTATIKQNSCVIEYGMLPTIQGHRASIKMLFQNLICNAIKFHKPGTNPHVKIGATFISNYWQFYVQDNGIGMREEYLDKIFVIFQRLHTADKYEGYGIGLAHCKKIVELHHGLIRVESELGKGSTFYFMIPAENKEAIVYVRKTA